MSSSYDSIIIGAGVMGCSIAFALASGGRRVLVLDKNPAAGYGSTSSSAAVLRTYYSTLESCALAWEGMHFWLDWSNFLGVDDERGNIHFIKTGSAVLRNGQDDGLDQITAHQDTLGIAWERWTGERLARELAHCDLQSYWPPRRHDDPDFGTPAKNQIEEAIYFPDSGFISDPQLATHNLQIAAEAQGAEFRFGKIVTDIRSHDSHVSGVTLETGEEINAPIVVNAGGPFSAIVNQMADALEDMTIATRPLRQEVCHLPAPSGQSLEDGGVMMMDPDIGCYIKPELNGSVAVGGAEPDCDQRIWVDNPDDLDRSPSDQWTAQVYRQALRIPTLQIPGQASGIIDLYDVTDDWVPIYDRSAIDGYYMAIGTSGNQFKNAPVAGQMMAALIDYCETGNDHDQEPLQFPFRYTEGAVDMSAFSRKRTAAKTTDSVMG
jgi:glycine/D-amino acid oxidase-like deaminating enzyme